MIELELTGLEQLQKAFGVAGSQQILVQPMEASLYLLQDYMSDYGLLPKKPDVGQRTGTLGRRWLISKPIMIAGGVQGAVGNNTSYGPWVQSTRFQVRWHRGFWQTDEMAITALKPEIESIFNAAIQRALDNAI